MVEKIPKLPERGNSSAGANSTIRRSNSLYSILTACPYDGGMQRAGIAILLFTAAIVSAQTPVVVPGGVLNAASFAKDGSGRGTPVAPGSLVSIFGTNLGSSLASADTVPFSTSLGGVSVMFGSAPAPLRDVIPAAQLVNAQIPFNVLPAGQTTGTVNVVVTSNGIASAPQTVQIVPAAPGIFTNPPGVGQAILVNLTDGSIAGPTSAAGTFGSIQVHPIQRGQFAFFYATGLGALSPPIPDGAADSALHTAVSTPVVMVGGITAQVLFAGQAPGFPGVYQVNIAIPNGAPTGNNVDLQIQTADGSVVSAPKISTIAIQ